MKVTCVCCDKEKDVSEFYQSELLSGSPFCADCIEPSSNWKLFGVLVAIVAALVFTYFYRT